jgi:hypothetical protein
VQNSFKKSKMIRQEKYIFARGFLASDPDADKIYGDRGIRLKKKISNPGTQSPEGPNPGSPNTNRTYTG